MTRLPPTTGARPGEEATPCFLDILLPVIAEPAEPASDRDVRDEEMVPGERVLEVVDRLGETFLEYLVDIRGAGLLGLGAGREEILGRDGGGAR